MRLAIFVSVIVMTLMALAGRLDQTTASERAADELLAGMGMR
ncbi:MAG: hypothetical protein ABW199_09275 [Caulobacterales bacterium]